MLVRFVVVCSALFALSGCLLHVQHNGYPLANIKHWESVKEGATRADVERTLGYPVIEEGDSWIYPSCLVYRAAASIVQRYSCDVLKVTFDKEGKVMEIERFHTPERRLRKISRPGVPVTGVNDGLLRRLSSAIGVTG
ncbi:hypothetical protein R4I06_04580 [Anaplasma bovis]